MNTFYEHHQDSMRFAYRCFDRILLNGLIQSFQRPGARAQHLAEIHVRRVLQELRIRIPGNLRRRHHGGGGLRRRLLRTDVGLPPFNDTSYNPCEDDAGDQNPLHPYLLGLIGTHGTRNADQYHGLVGTESRLATERSTSTDTGAVESLR